MDERTPLIQTVVVTRPRRRFPHTTFRRFCTIALFSCLVLATIGFLIPWAVLQGHRHHPHRKPHGGKPPPVPQSWPESSGLSFSDLKAIIVDTPDPEQARRWSKYYTSGPHLAGKNLSQALWTRERWEEFGVQSQIATYETYLTYPLDHRLALVDGDKVKYECSLTEDILDEDPTAHPDIPTFHGYSASGNVTAQYVFANFGTFYDFEDLVKAGIDLKGKIALVKYGRVFRGLKVKRAQELGMAGVVMYDDPQMDGEMTEENGHKPYPAGPARNPSSVQRGSVQFLSVKGVLPGDPTTPGYPSKPDAPRVDPHLSTPQIPSLPISYADALPLLKALNGHGPNASAFNKYWQGGGLAYKGVNYNIGPSKLDLNLYNQQEYIITPLWNVIGVVNGSISDEVIVVGNHRDAWIAGGAGDPNSGSAVLNEVIRSIGVALSAGWKPLRTIVFASWDGEEYGLVGSTEWVEEYLPWLTTSAIAYLNVDVGARGDEFSVAASPLLNSLIYNVTDTVAAPLKPKHSVRDRWDGHIRTMGSGSDFTAFQDFAGVPSIDFGYGNGPKDPVYHYHSNYDSFGWMDKFGDPNWKHHTTMAQLLGLFTISLSETPIIALNATDYATALETYLDSVKKEAETSTVKFSFKGLDSAILDFQHTARRFDAYTTELASRLTEDVPWWKWWKKVKLFYDVRKANSKYKLLERQFLYQEGLDDRPWFKHVIFAPGRWTGYAGATFPGLVESFEDGDTKNAHKWAKIIEELIVAARKSLE